MKELADKVAVITGGGAGIGAAMARRLAERGMKLVLADINPEALQKTASQLRQSDNVVMTVQTDVSEPTQIQSLVDRTVEEFGPPHLLCSNVGLIMFDTLENMTDAAWQSIWSINIMGVINVVSAFLPHMKKLGGERHITLTSSMYGFISAPRMGGYVTSKYAITGYGETLRSELAEDGIGVTLIFPTMVSTEHLHNSTALLEERIQGHDVRKEDIEAYIRVAASHSQKTVTPDEAVRNLVDDIENNRPYSVTHDGPAATFKRRSDEILAAIARADR